MWKTSGLHPFMLESACLVPHPLCWIHEAALEPITDKPQLRVQGHGCRSRAIESGKQNSDYQKANTIGRSDTVNKVSVVNVALVDQ